MSFLRNLIYFINGFFSTYIFLYTVYLFASVIIAAMMIERRARQNFFHQQSVLKDEANYLPVSVLVPAHNEVLTIVDTLKSLRRADYPTFEILVIDDGSTDLTKQTVIEAFHLRKVNRPIRRVLQTKAVHEVYESDDGGIPITLISKENGGKADALNTGINASQHPYFLGLDADSIVQRDTIRKLMESVLENSRVIACGGMVQVSNQAVIVDGEVKDYKFPKRMIVRFQLLEYCRTFLGSRMFMDVFNGNMIISGACGLFRKDIVVQVGGYDTTIIGEDMELVVKLHAFCRSHRIPYKITYAPGAVCWTQVPESTKILHSQRKRWHTGLIQSLSKHRNVLFNVRFGMMGLVSMIYYLIFECLAPFIEFIGLIFIVLAGVLGMLQYPFMFGYFALFIVFSALVTITSFFSRMYALSTRVTLGQSLAVIALSFLECIGFRQMITYFRVSALFNYSKNQLSWGAMIRERHNNGLAEAERAADDPTAPPQEEVQP